MLLQAGVIFYNHSGSGVTTAVRFCGSWRQPLFPMPFTEPNIVNNLKFAHCRPSENIYTLGEARGVLVV